MRVIVIPIECITDEMCEEFKDEYVSCLSEQECEDILDKNYSVGMTEYIYNDIEVFERCFNADLYDNLAPSKVFIRFF